MTQNPDQPHEFGVEPLTARSLALSGLLGTHPPRLPVRALVSLGELFGFAEGTMRTALSRMAASGEIEGVDGSYTLGERMRRRQASQDAGRQPAPTTWDGTWWIAIVDAESRSVAERRAFRSRMRQDRMGELRPDIWLRPANIAGPESASDLLLTRGGLEPRHPGELARRLWDLDVLAAGARMLTAAAHQATLTLEPADPRVLPETFMTSVAVVRYLQAEPLLPPQLVGPGWPADELRTTYDRLETAHSALLSSFLSGAATPGV